MTVPTTAEPPDGVVVGVDPHKRTLTACVLDGRGAVLSHAHFSVSGEGHRQLLDWAAGFGPLRRWGIEGASGLGRHSAVFLVDRGHDVRDVCPSRTAERDRARRRGKSDLLDAERIARETLAHDDLPFAFKRAGSQQGPDETIELMALWHNARRSIVKQAQQLQGEAEALLVALPETITAALPKTPNVRARLRALAKLDPGSLDAATRVRLELLAQLSADLEHLAARDREATTELRELIVRHGSRLGELTGLAERSVAEILVEVGDPRRFTEGGFARFNGTAPVPASSGEAAGEPRRHRLNRGGNRRVNAVLHRMAVTQLRRNPSARALFDDARTRGHTRTEAMRVLKRHLSNVVHRQMLRDQTDHKADIVTTINRVDAA